MTGARNGIEMAAASSLPLAELAGLFTASFEGYVVPMRVDPGTLRQMVELFDLDLDASRVARRDGRPVGFVNVGLRDARAWIGGMGVVPAERRGGVGGLLMRASHEAASARGAAAVWLEVIESNAPAIGLYERLGYERVRELEIWELDAEPPPSTAEATSVEEAHRLVRELRTEPEPWQRDDVVVRRLADRERLVGLVAGRGAAVVRVAETFASLEQVAAADEDAAGELVAGALALGRPLRVSNLPAGCEAAGALARLGGRVALRQHELRLGLGTPG